jgi:hypothetical protein
VVTFSNLGKYGRFGNTLFQIASTIGIAKRYGYEYGFPNWVIWDAYDRFQTTENINAFEYFVNPLPKCTQSYPEHFVHWGYHEGQPDNVDLVGHMQSEKYFSHCADEIKRLFTMKDEYPKNDYTAIHIRKGDYGDDYHPICRMDYYEKAMKVLPGPYLVFSDGEVDEFDCEVYNSDTYDAFKMMKSCKNHIIANSTYSWWAAWLAGGEVVAPSKWFGSATDLETKDIYPEKWIVI